MKHEQISYSTSRDIILIASDSIKKGLLLLISSLRSTQCKATIVIVTNNPNLQSNFSNLKISNLLIVFVKQSTIRDKSSIYKARWEWYYHVLQQELFRNSIDRIFHVDAFDSFFLNDPFIAFNQTNRSELIFISEDQKIKSCPYNSKWVKCHTNNSAILKQTILCSGSLMGYYQAFLHFIELMIFSVEWSLCWERGFDQGIFNIVAYTKLNNISYSFLGCKSGFITMNYCNSILNLDKIINGSSKLNIKPAVYIHQYNRFDEISNYLESKCFLEENPINL